MIKGVINIMKEKISIQKTQLKHTGQAIIEYLLVFMALVTAMLIARNTINNKAKSAYNRILDYVLGTSGTSQARVKF